MDGADLCYVRRFTQSGTMAESLYAFSGGARYDVYCYNIGSNTWDVLNPTELHQQEGSCLISGYSPGHGQYQYLYSVFGHQVNEGAHHEYDWIQSRFANTFEPVPVFLYHGADLAYDAVEGCLYTTIGYWRTGFYGRRVHGDADGTLSAGLLPGNRGPTLRHLRTAAIIEYQLDAPVRVAADVYDMTGRFVSNLFTGLQQSGKHQLTWNHTAGNGSRVSPGVYFVVLERGTERTGLKAVVW